ncbi:hypothetical protein AURDEDRAFT_116692 [Auricularia subglabra TFB-10046 SS5]|uniref:Uncharacterized protein n=1 Tax=Auricularia subglabra (strain TFB-10046 / SS5) TaxID=717982 RepID=J0WW93_AURST|nr:hypothetical protein AURDEDRAFT_116692 [Auricularia subglabra TFB-10046 SS5]
MGAALDVVRLALHSPALRGTEHSLRRYALGSRFGWAAIAQEAATCSLELTLDYVTRLPDMEMRDLERLLAFRHARIAAFSAALDDADGPFAFEHSRRCARAANHRIEDSAWTVLRQSMLLAMWQRPSGTSVLADGVATTAFRSAACKNCSWSVYDWDSFVERVGVLLQGLPRALL